jgi:N-acetylmuramoyl-L-alanine amidase
MNGLKFILTEPVTEISGSPQLSRIDLEKIINPVLRPSHIRDAVNFTTVILDPGHGGSDPGAINPIGTEAGYNLQVGLKAKSMLEKNGYRVVMTRQSDRYLTLQQRVDLANAVSGNAVFISIHFNSGGPDARGIETFTLSPMGVSHYGRGLLASDFSLRAGNRQDSANIALATAFHGSLKRRLGGDAKTIDRGIKRARFTVLSGVRHPAILIEGGFMSHPQEARLIANDSYRTAVANSSVDAVARYRSAITRKPMAATTTTLR